MASKKELKALITLAGKVDPSLQAALIKTTKNTKGLSESFKQSTRYVAKFGQLVKASFLGSTIASGVSILTNKVIELGKESIQLASDLVEVQNVVDTTFGKNASQIDAWAKTTLKAYGITELQAKQWSGSMGAMLKSSNITNEDMLIMSTNLAGLAGDMASFYNLDHDNAWQKIRSGIAGESEPLKELGINMSVANLEAYALAQGIKKSFSDMSQAEQTLLRYNYLMEVSADAQGDFARTSDSFSNQQKLLNNSIKQLGATIASAFLPTLTKLITKANEFVSKIDAQQVIQQTEKALILMGNAVKWLGDHINWLIPVAGGLLSVMVGVNAINTIRSITESIQGIKILTSSIQLLTLAKIKDKAETLYIMGLYAKDAVMKGLSTAGTWAMTAAQGALNGIMAIGTGIMSAFGAVLAFITSPIGLVIIGIGALIAIGVALWKNWDTVKAKAFELWEGIQSAFGGIGEWFGGLWNGVKEGFKGFINFIISGLNKIPEALNKLIGVGQSFGIDLPTLPTIPMFARGGIATQPSIFGEAGPEMAIPLKRTSRSFELLNQTAQILGVNPSQEYGNFKMGSTFDNFGVKEQTVIQKTANITIQVIGEVIEQTTMDIKSKVKEALEELEYEEGVIAFG